MLVSSNPCYYVWAVASGTLGPLRVSSHVFFSEQMNYGKTIFIADGKNVATLCQLTLQLSTLSLLTALECVRSGSGKLLLALASTLILGYESGGSHYHILMSHSF
jgi:hypothetical protein